MAVFGAPVAFEDAPLRACRAALSILDRVKIAGPGLEAKHGVRPHLRIGLNTGAAVIGQVQEGAEAGVTVLGDTVNFAARLQTLAEPDAVFMSEATHRFVQSMVEASFAGEHAIKGKTETQKVYRLDAVRPGVTRFEVAISRGLSAFVASLGVNTNWWCWSARSTRAAPNSVSSLRSYRSLDCQSALSARIDAKGLFGRVSGRNSNSGAGVAPI
jgi:hypothetical protein